MKVEFIKNLDGREGLQWKYISDNGDRLSIICNKYSYGGEKGEFETMCSWLKDVQGHLSFEQVAQKIKTIYKRERKSQLAKGEKQ